MTDKPKPARTYARPISVIVEDIGPLPQERKLPIQAQHTINQRFSRDKAKEMIAFLQKALENEHLEFIVVTTTGPSV